MTPVAKTSADILKLKTFFLEQAKTCVHQADGMLKHTFVTPSYAVSPGADDESNVPARSTVGHYLQMYDWDACFFSQGATLAGLPDLASSVVANFLGLQQENGYIPRTVSPHRIWDAGDMCKPFLCQSLVFQNKHSNQPPSEQTLAGLEAYLSYYQQQRLDKSGLYRWRNVLESGVDDNLTLIMPLEAAKDENEDTDMVDGQILAIDLSTYLVAEFRAFAKLCEQADKAALATKFLDAANTTLAQIEALMWDESAGMYFNLYPSSKDKYYMRAWTGLLPALLGLSSPERTEQVIQQNILNPEHFYRPSGLSSLAVSEPLYNNAKRGLYGRAIVSNWQGPMWILPNAIAVRCLIGQGLLNQATELAARVVNTMVNGLESHGTLFENYNAETGQPLWAPEFMSWNILTLELLQLLE